MTTQVEPQSHGEQRTSSEVTAVPGSEDEAIALLNQRAQSQAQDEPTDEPEGEPQDDPAPEPEEGEPEGEAEPADKLIEVEVDGKTIKVSPEGKDALLRQADYSRNMNALAETKKDYAQRMESAEKLIESAEKRVEVLAEIRLLDARLKAFEGLDWQQLRITDKAEFAAASAEFQALRIDRSDAAQKLERVDAEVANGRQKDIGAKQAEMLKVLAKDFPGWGEEAGERITKYARKSGYSDDDIRNFTDPRLVLALEKARKFDAIQDGKAAAQTKAREAQPVAKPGAPRRANPSNEAFARFQKSTSPDDAVAVFQERARVKQR